MSRITSDQAYTTEAVCDYPGCERRASAHGGGACCAECGMNQGRFHTHWCDKRQPVSRTKAFFQGVDKANKSLNSHARIFTVSNAERLGAWTFYALTFAVVVGFVVLMLQVMWMLSGQVQIPLDEIIDPLVIVPEG